MNLPKATEATTSLRQTAEAIERICLQLDQLGVASNSPLVATAIKSKLPYNVLTEIVKLEKSKKGLTTASDLRLGLQDFLSVREEVQRCYQPSKSNSSNDKVQHNNNRFSYNSNSNRHFASKQNNYNNNNVSRS